MSPPSTAAQPRRGSREATAADLVVRDAAIHTMTGPGRVDRAVAVRDGLIVATHTDPHGLDRLAGAATIVVEEPGLAVFPGLFDTHNHQLLAARDGGLPDLDAATTLNEVVAVIRSHARGVPPGEWVVSARSWHESNLKEKRLPTAAELDAATGLHPVLVRRGGHVVVANTAAMRLAGLGRDSPDPARGTMVRDPGGNPTGVFVERPAFEALERLIPAPSPHDQVRLLAAQCRRYNAAGITSVRDPGLEPGELPIYQAAYDRGGLTTRTRILMWATSLDHARSVLDDIAGVHCDTTMLRIDGIKIVVDGGVEGAALTTGYHSDPSYTGHLLVAPGELHAIAAYAACRGYRVACHAVGDRAIRTVVDTYAAVLEEHPQTAARDLCLEHGLLADAESRGRIAQMGITVTVQHPLLYALAANMQRYWGGKRTRSANPVKSWLDAGVQVAAGSDANVAPFSPMRGVWGLATRSTRSAGVQGAGEAISVYQALHMYTGAAARVTAEEAISGTIEAGHRADLVIFNRDPLEMPVEALPELEPICTILAGRAVFDAKPLLASRPDPR